MSQLFSWIIFVQEVSLAPTLTIPLAFLNVVPLYHAMIVIYVIYQIIDSFSALSPLKKPMNSELQMNVLGFSLLHLPLPNHFLQPFLSDNGFGYFVFWLFLEFSSLRTILHINYGHYSMHFFSLSLKLRVTLQKFWSAYNSWSACNVNLQNLQLYNSILIHRMKLSNRIYLPSSGIWY